jgi:hypothetical protein
MKLRDEWKQVIGQFVAKFAIPRAANESAEATEKATLECQLWTHGLAQQLKHSFPTAGFGHKSAGPGRPHSSDVVCLKDPFIGWDLIGAAGGVAPTLQLEGESIDLAGQIFEEVEARNWLDSNGGGEDPGIELDKFAERVAEVVFATFKVYLAAAAVKLNAMEAKVNELEAKLNAGFDVEFKVFGKTIRGKIKPSGS